MAQDGKNDTGKAKAKATAKGTAGADKEGKGTAGAARTPAGGISSHVRARHDARSARRTARRTIRATDEATEIGHLRRRFVRTSIIAVAVILVLLMSVINAAMSLMVSVRIDRVLTRLTGEDTTTPVYDTDTDDEGGFNLYTRFIPEISMGATNYSIITVRSDGTIVSSIAHTLDSMTVSEEEQVVAQVLASNPDLTTGHTVTCAVGSEHYAVRVVPPLDDETQDATASPTATGTASSATRRSGAMILTDDMSSLIVLDYTELERWRMQLFYVSITIAAVALLIFALIILSTSQHAVEPTVRALQNQKRFITNASHELKTPVAIIMSNAEMIDALDEEGTYREWTTTITRQSQRLTQLINALVQLTKAGEKGEFPISPTDMTSMVNGTAASFRALAQEDGDTLTVEAAENVTARVNAAAMEEVINILVDNATKYCDEGGSITVSLRGRGRRSGAVLAVSNDYAEGANVDYSRFFERFYRADESHTTASGRKGFGIGLAMAQELVGRMGGSMTATWADGRITFTVTLR